MRRLAPALRLLPVPMFIIGTVQLTFAILSVSLFHEQATTNAFLYPGVLFIIIGALMLWPLLRRGKLALSYRDSLLFVTLAWWVSGVTGGIPIMLIEHVSFTDATFESISGLTTTGATVISGLDDEPKTFLMYRQFLQWLGGLGVVIFVVAIMPMLNIGGMKLFKAETPGPMKDEKLSPRIAHTARYLWYVYGALTALCAIAYYLAGMSPFDAIGHSFSTVSTGGFSTYDASLGYFRSTWIDLTADVFMLLGAVNFALHFRFAQRRSLLVYWRDEECRWMLGLAAGVSLAVFGFLCLHQLYAPGEALSKAAFHVISFMTSTGFASGSFTEWPAATAMMLVFASYLGGCAGSTAGGNKIVRDVISLKSISIQFRRLVHPDGYFALKYQGRPVNDDIKGAVMSFMTVAAFITLLFSLALMATGLDFWSSFTAVSACINVAGPAFGALSSNFQPVSDVGTWLLSFAMILGRLEYFTILVLFSSAFWKR